MILLAFTLVFTGCEPTAGGESGPLDGTWIWKHDTGVQIVEAMKLEINGTRVSLYEPSSSGWGKTASGTCEISSDTVTFSLTGSSVNLVVFGNPFTLKDGKIYLPGSSIEFFVKQ